MRTITIDLFRIAAYTAFLIGVIVIGLAAAFNYRPGAWVGFTFLFGSLLAQCESLAVRVRAREDAVFQMGRSLSTVPIPRDSETPLRPSR